MYRNRGRHTRIVLGDPLPETPLPPPPTYKNIVAAACKIRDFLAQDPQRTHKDAAWHFRVTRARISQLMKIAENLPVEFVEMMRTCEDKRVLKQFSGKTPLRLAVMPLTHRQTHIHQLLEAVEL